MSSASRTKGHISWTTCSPRRATAGEENGTTCVSTPPWVRRATFYGWSRERRGERNDAVAQGRNHLRSPRESLPRQQPRRVRRLRRPDGEAAVPRGARHQLCVAAAVLSLAAA